jgi:hypothetical protein
VICYSTRTESNRSSYISTPHAIIDHDYLRGKLVDGLWIVEQVFDMFAIIIEHMDCHRKTKFYANIFSMHKLQPDFDIERNGSA